MSTHAFHRFVQRGATQGLHQAAMLARRPHEQAAMTAAWRDRMRLFALQRQLADYGMPAALRVLEASGQTVALLAAAAALERAKEAT